MGRIGRVKRKTGIMLLILVVVLALFMITTNCKNTLLLDKVKFLVLIGRWDEGVFDKSVFGE